MGTKEKKYEIDALRQYAKKLYIDELTSLFVNNIQIDNLEKKVPKDFVIMELLKNGRVAKWKKDGHFYRIKNESGRDRYGRPNFYTIGTANNIAVKSHVPREDLVIFKANCESLPYYKKFDLWADELTLIDQSIKVNLLNSQTNYLLFVDNEQSAKSVQIAYEDLATGLPAICVNKKAIGDAFGEMKNVSSDFIADRLHALHNAIWEQALKRCGIITANDFKRERVQTSEINANIGESIDYIYTIIDTCNAIAEKEEQPERFYFNGYVAELEDPQNVAKEDEQKEKEITENEKQT